MKASDYNGLVAALESQGIPIVSLVDDGIEYASEASDRQRDLGDRIFAAWPDPPELEPPPEPLPQTPPERILTLHNRLSMLELPVVGVARDRIDFAAEATEPQRAAAESLFAAWDWDAPPVPAQVTATQAKLALIDAGLYEAVDSWIQAEEGSPDGYRYRVVWDAGNWYRTSRELNEIATDLGLTDAQVDDLFRLAATK